MPKSPYSTTEVGQDLTLSTMTANLPVTEVPVTDAGPAGLLQTQIWLQHQIAAGTGAYNIPTALRLTGPLDQEALQRSLDEVVARHEPLRTRFAAAESGPRQLIYPPQRVTLGRHSLASIPPEAREAALRSELRTHARRPFDLERDLMIRAELFELSAQEQVLLLTTHHIASDGWSVGVLLRELKAVYEATVSGQWPGLPGLPIQYADYAAWQREQLLEGNFEEQLSYWRGELGGELPALDLALDRPRPTERQFEGERERLDLPDGLGVAIQKAAREFRVTDFTILFSAFQVLLARYCNQAEIITGTPVAGRTRVELEPLVGDLVNLLAIRVKLSDDTSTATLLARLREKLQNAVANQDVPFDQVVAALHRPPGASSVVQAVFALHEALLERTSWGPLAVEWIDTHTGTAKFDLNLTIERSSAGLAAVLEYRAGLFDGATIRRLLGHYLQLLESMLATPHQSIWKLPMLSSEERFQVVEEWNATRTSYPRDATIGELFHAQALASPHATAVVFESEALTYHALDEHSSALASHLADLGAGPGEFVALCMERSRDLAGSILAIIKSGAAYVPLDPDYPAERLELLLRDCNARIVLTHQKHSSKLRDARARLVELDRPDTLHALETHKPAPRVAVSPDSPAYVMYTSGSTGVPKGVVVPHRAVVRLVRNTNFADLGPDQTFLQFAPVSFDASTLEIWGPLLNGGKLCIAPPGKISLEDLGRMVQERGITTLWLTSALFNLMVEEHIGALQSLRQLLTGGDAASFRHFSRFLAEVPSCRLINGYGPTENTTFTACKTVDADTLEQGFIPIGKPVSNTQVYILDRFLQPVPIGVVGELFTSGDGLALEYLNAPELTAERFLPHPFHPGQRLYRTGDRARFLPNGDIQFLGRLDYQVKIRGFRIELGEIEHAVRLHPAVRDAVVLTRGEGHDKQLLCCWIPQVPAHPGANPESLRLFLKEKLPDYFIPAGFVALDRFPVNANGKVDRQALLTIVNAATAEPAAIDAGGIPASQATELEETLLGIWRDVLKMPVVGLHEDFFELGGHSLLATQVISRINKQLKLKLPLRFIFDHSTVARLALAARDLHPAVPAPGRRLPSRTLP